MIHVTLSSSALILVVLLCRRIFRKRVSQRLIYGLWLLVALRLLIPVNIPAIILPAYPTDPALGVEALQQKS